MSKTVGAMRHNHATRDDVTFINNDSQVARPIKNKSLTNKY